MEDILCNATIRFAEGNYVTLYYTPAVVEEGYDVGFLVTVDEEGTTHTFPITLKEEMPTGGGGHN